MKVSMISINHLEEFTLITCTCSVERIILSERCCFDMAKENEEIDIQSALQIILLVDSGFGSASGERNVGVGFLPLYRNHAID